VLTGQLAQLASTHLHGCLPDETRRAELTFEAVSAFVDQTGKFLRRHEGQSGRTEDDQIEDAIAG